MSVGTLGDTANGLVVRPRPAPRPRWVRTSHEHGARDVVALPPVRGRMEGVDAARAVAAVAVIAVHSVESKQLAVVGAFGLFAVPFYAVLAMYLQASSFRRDPGRSVYRHLAGRLRRLYVPFLAWSAIYLVVRNLKHDLLGDGLAVWPQVSDLWVGTAHHLWFLPFLTVMTIASAAIAPACARSKAVRWGVAGAAAAIGIVLAMTPRPAWLDYAHAGEGYLFLQSWRALPAAVLGVGLGWAVAGSRFTTSPRAASAARGVAWAGAILTVATIAWHVRLGYSGAARTLGGVGWVMVALAASRGAVVGVLGPLGRYAYGAYLAHVLVIEAVQAAAHYAGVGVSPGLDVFTMACGVAGAFGIAVGLSRCRALAWLNG